MVSPEKEMFFDDMDRMHLALTYDDVRLRTRHGRDQELPKVLDISSHFSRNVELQVPFVSAAMASVTESRMAIAMAELGGIGVIHSGLSIDEQKEEVRRVKYFRSGLIVNPVTVATDRTLKSVLDERDKKRWPFDTFPVVDDEQKLVGVLTKKSFEYSESMDVAVGDAMETDILTTPPGTSLEEAYKIMKRKTINTLPVVVEDTGKLAGLFLWTDLKSLRNDSGIHHNLDDKQRLRVAAAVPTRPKEALERIEEMLGDEQFLDVVVLDSADGDSYYAFKTLEEVKNRFGDLDVVVGNISEGDSAFELASAGADGIKVGQGPGSICSTRRETGIGMPQVTAVWECAKALRDKFPDVPICADGGIREHGDIPIAIAAGAHSVMMGKLLAGAKESPSKAFIDRFGNKRKEYWGQGSLRGLRSSQSNLDRYDEDDPDAPLPEGVESDVAFTGPVIGTINLCSKALRKGMRYTKSSDIEDHRDNARLRRITKAGLEESHPHGINIDPAKTGG